MKECARDRQIELEIDRQIVKGKKSFLKRGKGEEKKVN